MLESTSTRAFKNAGFDEEQAKALSEMMTDIFAEFATKTDLEREVARLDHRIELSTTELRGDIATTHAQFGGQLHELKASVEKSLKEQTWKLFGLVAFFAVILGIMEFFAT